jgi:hypothetical protein
VLLGLVVASCRYEWLIRGSPHFAEAPPAFICAISTLLTSVVYPPKEHIFRPGDTPNAMFMIVRSSHPIGQTARPRPCCFADCAAFCQANVAINAANTARQVHGVVAVTLRENLRIQLLKDGQLFGEISLLFPRPSAPRGSHGAHTHSVCVLSEACRAVQ